ncbi:hypothetical protein JYQ62_13585 [Nostoc sp. UHCC 0702]|nr:hypothetical protein JYQ62_13585 [Nostoc sp. UHCC 0702]
MVFSRSELELLTIPELRQMLHRYGLKPTGNAALKPGYITTLMVFPELALQQFETIARLNTKLLDGNCIQQNVASLLLIKKVLVS